VPKRAIKPTPISNEQPLTLLAQNINDHHREVQAVFEGMVRHAEAAGRNLIQAKDQVRYGSWEDWVTEHTDVSPRTARNYMLLTRRLAKLDDEERQRVAVLPLRLALQELADPSVPYQVKLSGTAGGPVQNITAPHEEKSAACVILVSEHVSAPHGREGGLPKQETADVEYFPPRPVPPNKPTAICRDLDDEVVSMSDANLLAALRLIDNAEVNTLARVAKLDDEINLEELAAHLVDAAVRAA
jgi:hypothetical protein